MQSGARSEGFGIGASLLRKEDDRHLRGRGQFVSDIRMPRLAGVVFLRSPHAHAHIRSIAVPDDARGCVFTAAELPRMRRNHAAVRDALASIGTEVNETPLTPGRIFAAIQRCLRPIQEASR
ncbi:MAG TPA: hypothetical protein VM782_23285 [Stellaceae bacterium]|nr:hypothetical protein [Stellaceae bacterium]